MTPGIVREWETTITATFRIRFLVEEDEDKANFEKWLDTENGKRAIKDKLYGLLRRNIYSKPIIEVEDIELIETEVGK